MKKLNNLLDNFFKEITDQNEYNRFRQNKKFIEKFCKKYNLLLTEIITTYETEKPKNMYFFNDNSGGYTLDGIKKSLY